ncbi:MAG: ribose-phosphate pyrophosphokinase [archaeon]
MNEKKLKIFTGNSNVKLAREVASSLGIKLGKASVKKFADGEINLKIGESVRRNDVFVIQSLSPPQNDHLMELLIFLDALRRASAERITAVIPWYAYSRQDTKIGPRDPISAKLVADLLQVAGADRILAVDLHSEQIQGFFNVPVDNLSFSFIAAAYFNKKKLNNLCVVSPDVGGVKRARNFANLLKARLAIIDKRRPRENESEVMHVIGKVKGKTCILFDDIIDTGGSMCNGAKALKENGAKKVIAVASHGLFSRDAIQKIEKSEIKEMIVSNSVPVKLKGKNKIKFLSIGPLLAEAIDHIHKGKSVSELFREEKFRQVKIV